MIWAQGPKSLYVVSLDHLPFLLLGSRGHCSYVIWSFLGGDSKVGWPNSIFENCWHAHGKQTHQAKKGWVLFKRKLL